MKTQLKFVYMLIVACACLCSASASNSLDVYKGAEAFAPQIRDRLVGKVSKKSGKLKFVPTDSESGMVIQLTDNTFWVTRNLDDFGPSWHIGDPALIEANPDDVIGPAILINLRTGESVAVVEAKKSFMRPEKDSAREYSLPALDKPCLFKLDANADHLQIGARKILWEFKPAVDGFLPSVDWRRGVTLNIRGSGNPDFPYWIVYGDRHDTWIFGVLVKPDPIMLGTLEEAL